ncbi:XRE family transcriptional regulator [Thalassospira sp. HF15]|uniref:helix-turn-helix domain-containing protein n=1 Tax=Thalassospira sp. HF15 TaxID=2722755 RepID=UPI001C3771BD|nr:XRE family transcriptional regulator [Thalassospira sp. HF15]
MAQTKKTQSPQTDANSDQGSGMDTMSKPVALTQDPHALREPKENNLEIAIGHEVRALRKKLGITISDLASATGISMGMLSKIENGVTSPSLTSLQALASALGVPLTDFFRRYEEPRNAVFVKAGEGIAIERRGTRAGHEYNLLGHIDNNTSGVVVEPYLLTLTEESSSFPAFQHEGMEFIYLLEGEVRYRHGDQLYYMKEGDSLFFDADARHGPEELLSFPIRYLSIICYPARG